jgi:hypothetical protein
MPYQTTVDLTASTPSFAYSQGDQYKSQVAFTEYYAGYGWFGTLTQLVPGNGYRIKVATGGQATFESI